MGALMAAVRANVPAVLWGDPGVGKTARVRQVTQQQLKWPLYEVIASIREPADFAGYPVPVNGHVRLVPSGEWSDFAEGVKKAGGGVLFLDEISCTPPAVQAALMRVVLDRHVGELQLPSSVRVVCAANPTGLAAGGWDLAAPLANRLLHITWPAPSVEDWLSWLISQSVLENDEPRWAGLQGQRVRALLSGYMQRFPGHLLTVPKDEEARGRAWCSPRSWEKAARALAEAIDPHPAELPLDALGLLTAAAVGDAASAELVAWARDADLPDPEVVLAEPKKWKVDTSRQDRVWATLAGVYGAVMGKLDKDGKIPERRWLAAWAVFGQADKHSATAAATAALAIPLAKAAAPGGPAHGLKQPDEVYAAQAIRREALGLPPVERQASA
jgi:hypothetical protein